MDGRSRHSLAGRRGGRTGARTNPAWLLALSLLAPWPAGAAPLFGAPRSYPVDGSPVRVVAADIDRAGGLDLVTGNEAGEEGPSLSFLLNRGDGTFFPETRHPVDAQYLLHAVASGDFDGDGAGDLAVAADDISVFPIRTVVLVFRNDGSGEFLHTDVYPLDGLFPQCLEAADATGDRVLDLVVCHSQLDTGAGVISVLAGQAVAGAPTGSFGLGADVTVGTLPTTVTIADVDADGRPDLLVGDPDARKVFILYGRSGGSFQSPAVLDDVEAPSAALVSAVAGAARPLVFVTSLAARQLRVFRQTAARTFAAPVVTSVGEPPSGMGGADFDGDGITDLVLPSLPSGQFSLWLGGGDGSFRLGESVPVGETPNSLAVAHLDQGGKPDVALSSLTMDWVTVALNGVDPPFTPTTAPTPTRTPRRSPTPTTARTGSVTPAPTRTPTRAGTPTPTTTPAGPGDANCDGRIDAADLQGVIARLFAPGCPAADLDGDGRVTVSDLLLVIKLITGS